MPELDLPYPRPQSLSDPSREYPPDRLASLLATPDYELDWRDFQCLLGPILPTGTYEESAHFLPLAFEYILTHDDDALDLVTTLVGFASEYGPQLKHDGALDAVRSKLNQCLSHWTSHFTVIHHDRDSCRERGWKLAYEDYVLNSDVVMEAVRALKHFKTHDDLAISFIADLSGAESEPTKSAWFLECVRAHVSRDIWRPPKHPEIRRLLDEHDLAIRHATTVRETFPGYRTAPTYWRDTFALLGIVDA